MTTHLDPLLDLNDDMLALRSGGLTAPERRTRQFLAAHSPHPAAAFDAAVPGARLTLLSRLAAALVREGLLPDAGTGAELTAPLAGGVLSIPVAARRAFGRLEIGHPIRWTGAHGPVTLTHPLELLVLLGGPTGIHEALATEVTDGCANLAMARAYWATKRRALASQARALGAGSTPALAHALRDTTIGFSAATFFERLCVEGHLLHPCAKTRLGLSPAALYAHGPEFDGTPALRLVGVLRDQLRWAGDEEPDQALFAAHPGLHEAVRREFADYGLDASAYGFVPVHPWQLERTLPAAYAYELDEAIMVPSALCLPCEATASFRTLAPKGGGALAFKVAVDAQMTSTVRSISPQTALNAPRFSALMREVFAREPERLAGLSPVEEVAGVCFAPADHEPVGPRRTRRERNLTAVYRVDVETLVGPDELAIVGTALYAESPVSARPVAAELMAMRGPDAPRSARAFLRDYAERLLPGALTLLTRYGVALEAHLQNCVPVFAGGAVSRVLIRDWGGARLYAPRLAARGLAPHFEPGSVTVTEDLDVARAKLFYTLFQNHLAELVTLAAAHAGEDEAPYWAIVAEVCRDTYAALAAEPDTELAARADWAALTGPTMPHKALTRMRLATGGGDRHVPVANPLFGTRAPW